jgi:glycosyltransferase involved in cell wall biosynthesis
MDRPLRIGVNALYLIPGGVGGTEIYLRHLLAALAQIDAENEYFVFLNRETAAAHPLVPDAPNFQAAPCAVRAVRRPSRLAWEQLALPVQARRRRLDVMLSPGFTAPLGVRRNVAVIHDLQHKRQPQNFGRLELLAWRALVWASARFSDQVITVSESSRRDILEMYGLPPGRVHVIHHGVEPAFFQLRAGSASDRRPLERAGIGGWPYLLTVSTVHPHKNWARWLEAYGSLLAEGWPQHLVIAGVRGNYTAELRRLLETSALRERVHLTGWVARPLLLELFRFAEALVFPSTFEGFGLPVLEAMAAGLPVACSSIPPLREVARDAALFFDPHSSAEIAAAVRRLLSEPALRAALAARGRATAANFTWTRAAEQTLAVLRRAAAP